MHKVNYFLQQNKFKKKIINFNVKIRRDYKLN